MVRFKLNISDPEEGETTSVEIEERASDVLLGKRIGDEIDGSLLDLQWKRLKVTGGSDSSGFPMRADVGGGVKKRILLTKGVGLQSVKGDGYRKRKTVRGGTVTRDVFQINMVIVEK